MRYLAINTMAQNWDTYGRMTHNYFLYADPTTSKLTWIPWDNNEALQTGNRGGSLNLDFSNLSSGDWPIIEFLYDDDVYRAKYDAYLAEFVAGVLSVDTMVARYEAYATLVEPSVVAERAGFTFVGSQQTFTSAINALKSHAQSRANATAAYLAP